MKKEAENTLHRLKRKIDTQRFVALCAVLLLFSDTDAVQADTIDRYAIQDEEINLENLFQVMSPVQATSGGFLDDLLDEEFSGMSSPLSPQSENGKVFELFKLLLLPSIAVIAGLAVIISRINDASKRNRSLRDEDEQYSRRYLQSDVEAIHRRQQDTFDTIESFPDKQRELGTRIDRRAKRERKRRDERWRRKLEESNLRADTRHKQAQAELLELRVKRRNKKEQARQYEALTAAEKRLLMEQGSPDIQEWLEKNQSSGGLLSSFFKTVRGRGPIDPNKF